MNNWTENLSIPNKKPANNERAISADSYPEPILKLVYFGRNALFTASMLALLVSCGELEKPLSDEELYNFIYKALQSETNNTIEPTSLPHGVDISRNYHPTVEATRQIFSSPSVPAATAEASPTVMPTPTPEVIAREPGYFLGGFNFINEDINLDFVTQDEGSPFSGISISFDGVEYPRGEEGENFENTTFAAGNKVGAITLEGHRNVVVFLHSGYFQYNGAWYPLEAEPLRDLLEGDGQLNHWTPLSNEEKQQRIESLIGTIINGSANGAAAKYIVKSVGFIPNEGVEKFEGNTAEMLETVIEYNGKDKSTFNDFIVDEKAAFIVFCGWGPNGETTYTRYILALVPVE